MSAPTSLCRLSIREAAKRAGVTDLTVRYALDAGDLIPLPRDGSSRIFLAVDAVDAWILRRAGATDLRRSKGGRQYNRGLRGERPLPPAAVQPPAQPASQTDPRVAILMEGLRRIDRAAEHVDPEKVIGAVRRIVLHTLEEAEKATLPPPPAPTSATTLSRGNRPWNS